MSAPRWPGAKLEDGEAERAALELRHALDEARERLPDDVTLRRMWARVSQPEPETVARTPRTPRWFWFVGGVTSTAALAVACVMWLGPRIEARRAAVAVRATPPATAVAETRAVPAAEGTVRTGAGERLHLRLVGGTEARLESASVMTVDRAGRPSVDGGEIAFSVPHQVTGHSYVVLAGPYRVIVLGTKFRLKQDDTHRVFVDVQEGVVEVWDRTRLARLSPGETWASPEMPSQTTTPAPPAAEATIEPARTHRARTVAMAAPPLSNDEAAARAQGALAAGEVSRALALYRTLAQRGGPAAENAAYEVGKILRDRMGQPANAVAAWRRYRADHPSGVLRVEADVSIIETLVHAGDTTGALAEANDFLRNHPDSERRAEIARVAGDLYRTRADYKRAVAAYQTALASPQVRDAAEAATFHRAECLVRLGDPTGSEATRAYLRRWPAGRFRTEAERLLESGDETGAARL